MSTLTGSIAAFILFALGLIHVYWAFGGEKWVDIVIPQTGVGGTKTLSPSGFMTLIVTAGLFTMAAVSLAISYYKTVGTMPRYISIAGWGIVAIFVIRAIGDFKYVGFFKSVTDTPFGTYDTMLFSPLCLLIAALFVATFKL